MTTTITPSTEKVIVYAEDAVPALPIFSHAVMDPNSGLIFCSGSIGCDQTFHIVEGGVGAQTRASLENLSKVLHAAGSSLEHVVKANVYLSDIKRDFSAMNEVYKEFFKVMPARTCVGVAALPLGACVEIECVAMRK